MFEQVDAPEFSYDIKSVILPDSVLSDILNPNMQVLVGDTLLQITRIGTFVVSPSHIQDFQTYYNANLNSINFDANYVAAPGEVSLGDGAYQVAPGIIRQESGSPDPLSTTNSVTYIPVPTGLGGDSPTALVYNTSTVDDGFNKEIGFVFNDWAKRRFVFRTYKTDFNIWVISFHKVGIQGYVQREKRFLWVTYWGESYADKIVVGCDNMNLETSYIFSYPNQFSSLARPTFDGFADFTIGNTVLNTLNINVNVNALGYSLNNNQISQFVNSQLNTVIGNQYNNLFHVIENNFLNTIDPTYLSRYANQAKKVTSLDDQHRFKVVLEQGEKAQGYSHENTWQFDWNINYNQKGYTYDMKRGSFFGRAQIEGIWHGIRIVR